MPVRYLDKEEFGAVVQLVRIPACHAGGRGFESRPLRQIAKAPSKDGAFCFLLISLISALFILLAMRLDSNVSKDHAEILI